VLRSVSNGSDPIVWFCKPCFWWLESHFYENDTVIVAIRDYFDETRELCAGNDNRRRDHTHQTAIYHAKTHVNASLERTGCDKIGVIDPQMKSSWENVTSSPHEDTPIRDMIPQPNFEPQMRCPNAHLFSLRTFKIPCYEIREYSSSCRRFNYMLSELQEYLFTGIVDKSEEVLHQTVSNILQDIYVEIDCVPSRTDWVRYAPIIHK